MRNNLIILLAARILIPLIILFALYVQFHGDYSPGGGFQAGVIFAAGWILFALVYGLDRALEVIPLAWMYRLMAMGALLYAAVGLAGVALGGRFLDFYPLLADPQSAQQAGIMLVEFGVGVTVASVMMLVFALFARRKGDWDDANAGQGEP
ncbi:Na(+)/H(+) antiporter subunit B [Luteimonas vadosa]|uniref:Na(+)/H(+) antiporter subunit B n=1 Tax=Luteimonas vadosa TaxID=1165507 RepID=A0ABP9DU92_9GAMM